jgi:KEOPS complex subunit Cgi121
VKELLHYVREYSKYAEITGYRNIDFAVAESYLKANRKEAHNVDVQFFDAEFIATQEHLFFAVLNALTAFNNRTNISKSLSMETMLYASAKRQIQKAIEQSGIKPQTINLAVAVIGENPSDLKRALDTITACVDAEPDEKVLNMSKMKEKKIKEMFQISDDELQTVLKDQDRSAAVINLVIERVALLTTQL